MMGLLLGRASPLRSGNHVVTSAAVAATTCRPLAPPAVDRLLTHRAGALGLNSCGVYVQRLMAAPAASFGCHFRLARTTTPTPDSDISGQILAGLLKCLAAVPISYREGHGWLSFLATREGDSHDYADATFRIGVFTQRRPD